MLNFDPKKFMFPLIATFALTLILISVPSESIQAQEPGVCPDFDSNLSVGGAALFINAADAALFTQPDTSSDIIAEVSSETRLQVLVGPLCIDETTWWYMEANSQLGWAKEADGDELVLQPDIQQSVRVREDLPPDLSFGLASASGGGGGCLGTCCGAFLDFPVFDANLPDWDPQFDQYQNIEDGDRFTLISDMVSSTPESTLGICTPANAGTLEERAFAISPTGEEFAPFILDNGTVQLPLQAFVTPGQWTLGWDDFAVQIDIPADLSIYTAQEEEFVISGLEPFERAALVYPDQIIEARANLDGHVLESISALDNPEAVISENGLLLAANFGFPPQQYYFGPLIVSQEQYADLLQYIIWETEPREAVTCVDDMPSRLQVGGQAQVVGGDLTAYEGSELDANQHPDGVVPGNATYTVIYGPVCNAETARWLLLVRPFDEELVDWSAAWVDEYQDGDYRLEPVGTGRGFAFGDLPAASISGSGSSGRVLRVTQVASDGLVVRPEAAVESTSYLLLMPGSEVEVVDGPIISGGDPFYEIRLSDEETAFVRNNEQEGWAVIENSNNVGDPVYQCAGGDLQNLFTVGDEGYPSFGFEYVTLRSTPGGDEIIRIPEGDTFTVIGGPACTSNVIMWFQVQYGDIRGWISQGNESQGYWTTLEN